MRCVCTLHGMAATWADLIEQNNADLDRSRWLIEQMLRAESTDRATRSVSHQMNAAKFPVHRELTGFDSEVSPVDRSSPSVDQVVWTNTPPRSGTRPRGLRCREIAWTADAGFDLLPRPERPTTLVPAGGGSTHRWEEHLDLARREMRSR